MVRLRVSASLEGDLLASPLAEYISKHTRAHQRCSCNWSYNSIFGGLLQRNVNKEFVTW